MSIRPLKLPKPVIHDVRSIEQNDRFIVYYIHQHEHASSTALARRADERHLQTPCRGQGRGSSEPPKHLVNRFGLIVVP
jgi:hypothetical protein